MQYEDLNSKSQIPNPKQAPNSKFQFSKRKPRQVSVSARNESNRLTVKTMDDIGRRFTVDGQEMQYEDLNSKLQIPNTKQAPILLLNFGSSFGSLGNWNLEFYWNLVLEIWNFILIIASFLHVNRQPSTVNRLQFVAVTLRLTPYAVRQVLQVPLRCIHD